MILGKLGASLLENILADKGINRERKGFTGTDYEPKISSIKDF